MPEDEHEFEFRASRGLCAGIHSDMAYMMSKALLQVLVEYISNIPGKRSSDRSVLNLVATSWCRRTLHLSWLSK